MRNVTRLAAGAVSALVNPTPSNLIEAVAGLALIGASGASAKAALEDEDTREVATVTFLFTASGISLFGKSGAFWDLIAGGLVMFAMHSVRHIRS